MSMQRDAVNLALKTIIKPLASRLPIDSRIVSPARSQIDRFASLLTFLPKNISIEEFRLDHMDAEWITPLAKSPRNASPTTEIDALEAKIASPETKKVLLYFHGGAYLLGSPKTHRNITSRIAVLSKMKVLAINYRKAPEFTFPTPIEDAIHAYEYLLNMNYQPENIMFAGDSAGGNLTLTTLLSLKERNYPLPKAGICLSPWTDLTASSPSVYFNRDKDPMIPAHRIAHAASAYCADIDPDHPLISPVFADLSGLPRLLVHVGDTEVLRDDSHRLVKKAREDGVDVHYKQWRNQPHVFQIFAGIIPQSSFALRDIGRFIKDTFQQPVAASKLH